MAGSRSWSSAQERKRASSAAVQACISGGRASEGLGGVDRSVGLNASPPLLDRVTERRREDGEDVAHRAGGEAALAIGAARGLQLAHPRIDCRARQPVKRRSPQVRVDVQPDVLAVAGERGQREALAIEPFSQERVETLPGRLDPLTHLSLPDLSTKGRGRLASRREATLEDRATRAVLTRHRVLDEEAGTCLRGVLADPALAPHAVAVAWSSCAPP
jgi:hypothetical protein